MLYLCINNAEKKVKNTMKQPKKQMAFKLSDSTAKELASIAKRESVSQAEVISILVHFCYQGWMEAEQDKLNEWFDIARRA